MPLHLIRSTITLLAASSFACATCYADHLDAHAALEDTKLYFTAPLRWDLRDWTYFGATLTAVAVAHEYDDDVRTHFGTSIATANNSDPHSTRDWEPAVAIVGLTWAYAALIDDSAGYDEGKSMLEATAFTAVSTELFKLAAGRRRPFETSKVDDWHHSGSSFPSSHASITFAVGTVLAESGSESHRWLRRILGYGAASAVSYARVHDGAHWLSDTVAGAALGIATGHFVTDRQNKRYQRYAFSVQPTRQGAMLTYTYALE